MPHLEPYSDGEIEIVTHQALATLLWVAGDITDDQGESTLKAWDQVYSVDDFSPEQVAAMRAKLEAFMTANLADLLESRHFAGQENNVSRIGQIGHDYVLTTGGHGAGFWDRGLGEVGDRLTEACRADRHEWYLYIGDDGKLYCADLT